jgi:hypothetical protein
MMKLEGLAIDLERCPDGVELADLPWGVGVEIMPPELRGAFPTTAAYRYRTDRRQTEQKMIENLENPVVVAFANAIDDQKRLRFFGRYGIGSRHERLLWNHGTKGDSHIFDEHALSRERVVERQLKIREMLEDAAGKDPVAAMTMINSALVGMFTSPVPAFHLGGPRGAPQLLLKCRSLECLMVMEIAMIVAHDVSATRCEHCDAVFLTGQLTGRRSSARFCSDKCRVAAMRKRQVETGGNHVNS